MAAEACNAAHRPKLSDNPVGSSSRITQPCRMGRLLAARYIQPSFTFLAGVHCRFRLRAEPQRTSRLGSSFGTRLCGHLSLSFWGSSCDRLERSQNELHFEVRSPKSDSVIRFVFARVRLATRTMDSLGAILVGYWVAFALYPLPGANFDCKRSGCAGLAASPERLCATLDKIPISARASMNGS